MSRWFIWLRWMERKTDKQQGPGLITKQALDLHSNFARTNSFRSACVACTLIMAF
jgi:hypothetical protein